MTMMKFTAFMGAAFSRPRRAAATLAIVAIAALLALPALAPHAFAQWRSAPAPTAEAASVRISATVFGSFDYTFEGTGAWVGHALVRFGDNPPKLATFADRNTSFGQRANGAIYGTETISLRFTDGSGTFDILGRFEGTPQATPNLYTLHEVGSIANGKGRYAQASGSVSIQGPFLFPDPTIAAGAPPWIAELHGVIHGTDER